MQMLLPRVAGAWSHAGGVFKRVSTYDAYAQQADDLRCHNLAHLREGRLGLFFHLLHVFLKRFDHHTRLPQLPLELDHVRRCFGVLWSQAAHEKLWSVRDR